MIRDAQNPETLERLPRAGRDTRGRTRTSGETRKETELHLHGGLLPAGMA
jgi:hypothetical protein